MPSASYVCLQLPAAWANDPQVSIEEANLAIRNAFFAVLDVEHAGKEVTELLLDLNNAASLLAEAENTYNSGSLADVVSKANYAAQIAHQVKYDAENLGKSELFLSSLWVTVIFSVTGSLMFSAVLLLTWRRFKQVFLKKNVKLESYRYTFFVIGLIGVLLFSAPALSLLRSSSSESFSTIYLLGPDRMTHTIPFNIQPSTQYSLYLGIKNNLGSTANYICLVKLTNDTDPLPNRNVGTPSSLPTLYKFNLFLQDGQVWEAPLSFQFNNVSLSLNEAVLESITFNDVDFSVNKTSQRDPVSSSYHYGVLVELWALNESTGFIQYQNRFVHFYLNLTETM